MIMLSEKQPKSRNDQSKSKLIVWFITLISNPLGALEKA